MTSEELYAIAETTIHDIDSPIRFNSDFFNGALCMMNAFVQLHCKRTNEETETVDDYVSAAIQIGIEQANEKGINVNKPDVAQALLALFTACYNPR